MTEFYKNLVPNIQVNPPVREDFKINNQQKKKGFFSDFWLRTGKARHPGRGCLGAAARGPGYVIDGCGCVRNNCPRDGLRGCRGSGDTILIGRWADVHSACDGGGRCLRHPQLPLAASACAAGIDAVGEWCVSAVRETVVR